MSDQFDVTLVDTDLLEEVHLTVELIIAASEAPGHLSVEEIDAILGVTPRSPGIEVPHPRRPGTVFPSTPASGMIDA